MVYLYLQQTFTPGSDITIKYNTASSGYGRLVIGYRTLQSDDVLFSWTSSSVSSSTTIWGVSVFRNVYNIGDPFEAGSGTPTTFITTSPNPPAATVTTVGSAVFTVYGKNNDYTSISAPSGYTLCGSDTSTSGSDASAAAAYRPNRAAGAEDPGAWTLGGGQTSDAGYVWTGVLKALQHTYRLDIEEQWINVNASNVRQDLCIKTGSFSGSEPLVVQVWHGGSWANLMTLAPSSSNNATLRPYIDSSTLAIRFVGYNDVADPTLDTWDIDAVYIKPEKDVNFLVNYQQDSTFTLEILQNGTMCWLGQNLTASTQSIPIPRIPVKALHVNETINGVNQEVPFQIEDWASNYTVPLSLTSNTTVFSNRQMIVFQLNSKVTDFTVWWDGRDNTTQTSLAYTNRYFNDVSGGALNNSKITLTISGGTGNQFSVTSQMKTASSTAKFMRINAENGISWNSPSYVIFNGVVRDIVQQEAEFDNGAGTSDNCPNLYASIILTLPANTTYYTYQLRIMFINSAQQRTITDLCPIQLNSTVTGVQAQTENGTLAGLPIVQTGTGTFLNSTRGGWTPHHFTQLISSTGKGAGIIFTDAANQNLYAFDSFPGSTSKGALRASSGLELLPVCSGQGQVQFRDAYDITWAGAVATFDGSTPVCSLYDGTTPMGLWILVEYPPTLTVTPKS